MVTIRANGEEPDPRGDLITESANEHQLAINIRALGDAAVLRAIVERTLSAIPGSVDVRHFRAFHPPPPQPEHRFRSVAER